MGLCLAMVAGALAGTATAQTSQAPDLHTNQAYVEEVMRETRLDVNDPMAVFAYVLDSLPARVKVYPTENHYYFSFFHDGVRYAGNIRLDASNRDEGKLIFAYFEDTAWKDNPVTHRVLDGSQGVAVEKLEPLVYRVTYRDKSVVFALNDLLQVKPPPNTIGPDETFIGPIFDEFGDPLLPDL